MLRWCKYILIDKCVFDVGCWKWGKSFLKLNFINQATLSEVEVSLSLDLYANFWYVRILASFFRKYSWLLVLALKMFKVNGQNIGI